MPQFVGLGTTGTAHDVFAYSADGDLWNGTAYVTPPAAAASATAYRVAATEKGDGRFYATLPAGYATWELRLRASTYGASIVVYQGPDADAVSLATGAITPAKLSGFAEAGKIDAGGVAAIADAVDNLGPGTGSGDTPVDHATLGDEGENLRALDADDDGVSGVTVTAYVAADYTDDPKTADARAQVTTNDAGEWSSPMMLDAGTPYTITYVKSGFPTYTVEVTP